MRAATRNIIRKIWYGGWIFGASFLIMLALVFSAIRVMLPLATDYKSDIESLAARTLGHPVQIARIDTDWLWFRPRLKLIGVRVDDAAGGSALFAAEEVILAMNPFSSIMHRHVEIDELTVVRTDFSVNRDETGQLYAKGFALPLQMEPKAAAEPAVPAFLLNRTLRVVDSAIGFADAASGTDYRLEAVNLALQLGREHQRLYLSVNLPGEIGERFEAGAELRGDPRNLQGLKGRLYMRAAGLELPAVLQKTRYRDSVSSGRLDFALWAELDPEAGREIQGNISLQDFAADFAGVPLLAGLKSPFDRMSADLRGHIAGDDLDIELENLLLSMGEDIAPLNGLAIKTSSGASAFERGEIMIDHLRLKQVWPVALHYPSLREALARAGIQAVAGDLLQFYGKWDLRGGGAPNVALVSRFEELGITGSGKTPSISALRGTARLHNNNAVINLETVGSQLDYPHLFRNRITLQSLDGAIYARFSDPGLTLAARDLSLQTPHMQSRHWFDLQFTPGKAPYANIYSTYEDGDVRSGPQYLPVAVMSDKLVSWLDQAVVGGRLVAGDLELRGPLDKFPFRHNEGVFRIDTDFDGMEINYFHGWPHLQNARLHTRFYGAGMGISVHEGRVSDTDISGADAWIKDFHQSRLVVQAPVSGPLSGTVSYLHDSGLREHLEPLIDQVTASGALSGLVYLDLPLHEGPTAKWSFTSSISDGALAFSGMGLEFKNMNCTVRIDQESIRAAPFMATLNNHPVSIDIATHAEEAGNTAHISIAGETAPADLLPRNGFDPAQYIKGAALLEAAIDLPLTKTRDSERYPSIDLRLDAAATTLSLPEPFAKEAGVPAVLSAHSQFRNRSVLMDVAYGGWLEGKLRFEAGALERAGIRLFEGSPSLPATPGFVVTGRVDTLNIDQWLALGGAGGTDAVNPLQYLELRTGRLIYLQRTLPGAVLRLTQQPRHWLAAVESELLTGSAAISKPGPSRQKLSLDLKYADFDYFAGQSHASDKPLMPGDIPPFKLKAERIVLNGWNLLQAELDTAVDGQVLSGDFRVGDPDVGLEGKAEWSANKKGAQRTEISLAFDSKNVGRGLGKFGYAEIIREGTGTAKFDLAWPASPPGFDLSIMSGEGQISLKEGRVLDIKPGGGRLFGLLSVQTIPRRLAFDFSDIFEEGFSFDKMKGNFDFSAGNAYTDNYVIDGPVGRIDIKGRVGMVQHDYDQSILFRPDLSSSLPVVGTLLGGTGAGLALIMVDRFARLFGKQTDDLARLEYTLKGSWDDPVMAPVKPALKSKSRRKDKDN